MTMKNKLSRGVTAAVLVLSGTLATGCGSQSSQNGFMDGFSLKTEVIDGAVWAHASGQFATGGLVLPALTMPIFDPKRPGVSYGTVAILPTLTGKTELKVSVNISEAAHVQNVMRTMPNGTAIPVGGIDACQVLGLPVGSTKTVVYLGLGDGCAILGVALAIKELDKVGTYVGLPINFFPRFDFGKGVVGVAGVFTGQTSGSSGIAFFADLSSALKPQTKSANLAGLRVVQDVTSVQSKLTFRSVQPGNSAMRKLYRGFGDVKKGRVQLH